MLLWCATSLLDERSIFNLAVDQAGLASPTVISKLTHMTIEDDVSHAISSMQSAMTTVSGIEGTK